MSVLTAVLAMGVALGYFTIAALIVPRIRLEDATRRFVTLFRVGGIAFFVGCGLTHSHIAYHALADDEQVGTHEAVFHLLQVGGVWVFIYAALRFLDVRVARRKTPEELEAEELARRIDELSRSNADLEQFAHVAAHDLQGPLRTLTGFSETLLDRRGQLDPADADELLRRIATGGRRMSEMLDGVLEYSRVAGPELVREEVDLGAVLAEVRESLAAELGERGTRIVAGSLPTVSGDRVQLRQLLQNLLSNASRFGKTVEVGAAREGDYWELHVRDDGPGIPADDAERIFEMFERLDARDDGSGLGLALCRKIVERHGGRIWLADSGSGADFRFSLPATTRAVTSGAPHRV